MVGALAAVVVAFIPVSVNRHVHCGLLIVRDVTQDANDPVEPMPVPFDFLLERCHHRWRDQALMAVGLFGAGAVVADTLRRVGRAQGGGNPGFMLVLFLLAAVTATSCAEPAGESSDPQRRVPEVPIRREEPPREILTPQGNELSEPLPDPSDAPNGPGRSDRPVVQAVMTADGLAVTVFQSQKGDEGSDDLRLDDEWVLQGAQQGTDSAQGTLPGESDFVLQPGEHMAFIIPNERLPSVPGNYAVILRYESNGTIRTAPPDIVNIGDWPSADYHGPQHL